VSYESSGGVAVPVEVFGDCSGGVLRAKRLWLTVYRFWQSGELGTATGLLYKNSCLALFAHDVGFGNFPRALNSEKTLTVFH
jgi:hypothetical protein